jgi:hypothetical protein
MFFTNMTVKSKLRFNRHDCYFRYVNKFVKWTVEAG